MGVEVSEPWTPCWRVSWGLDIVHESQEIPVLNAPDVNCFRIRFPDEAAAVLFRAELQRWMGDMAIRAVHTAREDTAE